MKRQSILIGLALASLAVSACDGVLGIQLPSSGNADGGAEDGASPPTMDAASQPGSTDATTNEGSSPPPDSGQSHPDGPTGNGNDGAPMSNPDSGPGADSGPDAPNDSPDADAGPPTCDAGVDLTSDRHNCGRCGRDCAGASCVAGECSPFTVVSQQDYTTSLAIDSTGLYWGSEAYSEVLHCPLGCATAPVVLTGTQGQPIYVGIGGGSVYWESDQGAALSSILTNPESKLGPTGAVVIQHPTLMRSLVVDSADIIWTEAPNSAWQTYHCPLGGCDAGAAPLLSDPVTAMVSDDTNLVWSSAGVALKTCQKSQCVQQSLISTGLTQANAVALYNGVAYVADLGGANPGTGSISSCPLSATSCTAGNFASGITHPGALAVDGSGVYWASPEPGDGAAPTYGLYMCPLAGCPASGPRELVANQPGGMGIVTTYANLVYFTIGSFSYSIMAVAKP